LPFSRSDERKVTGPPRRGRKGWCFGGSLVTDPAVLASIDHEVYGSFAELDNGIPPEQVEPGLDAWQRLREYLRRTLSD
jgi:hypothetical protein